VVKAVFRREEICEGPHVQRAPDILMLMADEGYVAYECDVDVDEVFELPGWRNGDHTLEGVLAAAGKHTKKGTTITRAGIIDLAPTILYTMGVPIPDDMDGQILTDLFEDEFLDSSIPVTARTFESAHKDVGYGEPSEDREIILERLRGLGYVD
jgi:predicted AlkP superfamily phosphohydrolase/phosphomutase